MKSILLLSGIATLILFQNCKDQAKENNGSSVIAKGQMPNITKDHLGNLHLVYGKGDSILYSFSADGGNSFSSPALISVLPKLAASHMRGPQIAVTDSAVIVTACNEDGDIFSFSKNKSDEWTTTSKVNDADTVAKEGLMALAADGQNSFAVWIDLRDKQDKIFGARSTDGGNTWSKNIMIYASPDSTVCECCKPSVEMKGDNVYVMFRNWLNGNRDLYLIQSSDGGNIFGEAKKLGNGNWKLDGCPMDGGELAISNNNNIQTVWRRQSNIFSCEPGKQEQELGKGKSCTMESLDGKNVYAWTENGEVVVLKPQGVKFNLGKGQQPLLKSVNNKHVICIWENEKQIHKAVVEL
jgi:hypothetical protein